MNKQIRVPLTHRDFQEILDAFTKPGGYLQTHYGDLYIQFRDTAISRALLEFIASVGETFNFTAGIEVDEGRLVSARQPASVIEIADSLGYDFIGPLPAYCNVQVTVDYDPDLVISAPILLATEPSLGKTIFFEVLQDVQKPTGVRTLTLTAYQGETFLEPTSLSEGLPSSTVDLEIDRPVIFDSLKVKVNGVIWTRVTTFVDSNPADRHYKIRFREDIPGKRTYFIEFGDGINGMYPPASQQIEISGRVGGSDDGNVPAGRINQLRSTIYDANGASLNARVISVTDATNGKSEETIEEIRMNAFRKIFTNSRSVSRDDFTTNAIAAGARRAVALTKNEWPALDENTIAVIVSNQLGVLASKAERDAIATAIPQRGPSCGTEKVRVHAAAYRQFKVLVEVECSKGAVIGDIKDLAKDQLLGNVTTGVKGLLTYDGVLQTDAPSYVLDIGQPVRISWITDVIDEIPGVVHSHVRFYELDDSLIKTEDTNGNVVPSDLIPNPVQVPWPTTVTINVKRTGT